jgi:3-oxoacyl-[acyl-carrier protein] reductase
VGNVSLVTGGNRGIGAAIARRLREAGDTVVVGSRSGTSIDDLPAVTLDVANPASITSAIASVEESTGSIHTLVANAGITRDGLLMRMSDADIDDVLTTNLAGAIRCARAVLRGMLKARAGRIIFISSVVWAAGSGGQVNYAASKAGLIGAARSLAREVGGRNITVNVVAPGFVETDMTASLDDARRTEIAAAIPLGRYAEATEIADAVAFLAGDKARYITGAIIPVDGGLGMGH